ncbi:MATH domain and coiled-coil domain-containing protein At3g58410-like [Raphanus sativus]|uniref:MATH domain and coiled-coil domain-containing protein At3g58410-like n=1 Tax=Raphanus sativus TaxID=3726 RepID=A0A6J0N651_RAPSA|nr:MATH domain and coiled-coil domain-containing protein At3g58410-like [Raphanus sativus]
MACTSVVLLPKVLDKDSSFVVNDEVKIVVEFDIFQDIPVETEKSEENVGVLLKEGSSIMESFNVNGFHVFPSQVVSVRRIFEKHPDIAVDFRAKNQHVRNACMSYLLGLIETLCQSLHQLSDEDLIEADIALKHLKDAGFKVDWLEKNLENVKGKKIKQLSVLAMLQETEGKSQKLKREFEELDALAEEQKKELTSTRTSLSFDDVV